MDEVDEAFNVSCKQKANSPVQLLRLLCNLQLLAFLFYTDTAVSNAMMELTRTIRTVMG